METQVQTATQVGQRAASRLDQAETLRRLVLQASGDYERRTDRAGALILVVGARPQAGASTVALHLTLRLHRRGWPVGWVDTRDGDEACWADGLPEVTWIDVARGDRMLREAWQDGPQGIPTLLAPAGCHGATAGDDDLAWDQLRHAARQQLIVVDGGSLDLCQHRLAWADHVCIVADEGNSPVAEVYSAIKRAAPSMGAARCWLMLNRVHQPQRAVATRQRIVSACSRFLNMSVAAAGELPEDAQLDEHTLGRPWVHVPPTRQVWDQVYGQWVQRLEDLWTARPRWTRWGQSR